RSQPFLGIGEHGVDIENHAPERVDPVLHDLADRKLGLAHRRLVVTEAGRGGGSPVGDFHGESITPNGLSGNAAERGRIAPDTANTQANTAWIALRKIVAKAANAAVG